MDHEKGNTLKVYIKQYLNRYKGCFALVAGIMIFYIFTLYLCGVSAADIRYFAGLEIVFLVGVRCILRDTVLVSPADSKKADPGLYAGHADTFRYGGCAGGSVYGCA